MKTINQNRLDWIDYARGIAIILVVYRHMFEGLKNTSILKAAGVDVNSYLFLEEANIFFFSFRMPLFFFVSGIFISASLAKRGFGKLAMNKTRTILYPYFLWGFIQITIQIIFSAFANSNKSLSDYTYLFYVPREVEQFWYLLALFNVIILYAFLKTYAKIHFSYQIALGALLFLISSLFHQFNIEWGFVSDIFHYYIFLAIGDALGESMVKGRLRRFFSSNQASLILLPPFLLLQYYFLKTNLDNQVFSPKFLYVEYYQPFMYLLVALTGCAFVIAFSSLLEKYHLAKWLNSLGRHSLYIYVMHVIVFAGMRVVLTHFLGIYNVYILMVICITTALVVPILVFKLTERMGWYYVFTLEKNDKKIRPVKTVAINKPQPSYES